MRLPIYLSILLVVIFVPLAIAQQSQRVLRNYQEAERLYNLDNPTEKTDRKALQLFLLAASELTRDRKYDSVALDCYLKAGILQQSANQQQQSILSFVHAIAIQQNSALADSFRFKPYLFIGSAYYELNNFDSAFYFFKLAEQLSNQYPHIGELERLYNKTGTMYYETGNYVQSRFYFEKALAILDTNTSTNRYLFVNYKNNIASALRKLHKYEQALFIYQSLLPYGIEKNGLLQNIADTYLAMGEYGEAIAYLRSTSYSNQKKSNDLAFAFLRLHRTDSAAFYIADAMHYDRGTPLQKLVTRGRTLSYLGDLNVMVKNTPLALQNYQAAIIQMDPDFNEANVTANPVQFEGIHSFSNLFETLVHKAEAFSIVFDSTKKQQDLINAVNTMQSAFILADKASETYGSDEARLFLNENLQPAYKSMVEWCIQLYDNSRDQTWLNQAIANAEKSKAAVLQSSLLQLPLMNIKGMPHNLLLQERNLKSAINRFTLLLSTLTDSIQLKSTSNQLLNTQIELSKIHEKLDEQKAYSSLWKTSSVDINKVRNDLEPDVAICSYYFSRGGVIEFLITKDTVQYHKIPGDSLLIKELGTLIQQVNQTAVDPQQINALQQNIYSELIQPQLSSLESKKRLIIIPHNELAYLPFEILKDQHGKLLLEKFSVAYDYSLLFLQFKHSFESNDLLVAFAPFATQREIPGGFSPIPASRIEVSALEGKIFTDSNATKQQFMEVSSQFGIAHLATHASANDSLPLQSFIAFYPAGNDTSFKLYEPEIYNLELQSSKLIVLSACETGAGKLVHGEGLLSLSRAFSYAGCPSIITSLWKADDEATSYICRRLHHYLEKGLQKDIALQRAKEDYLQDQNISQQFKLPQFWANLVLVGDSSPVKSSSEPSPIIRTVIIVFVIILIIFLTGIYKKR